MSGLNAIEMSSLTASRRSHVYRVQPGPDYDEPAGAGLAQGHGVGVAGTENPSRGSSVGGPVGPANPTYSAQAGSGWRYRAGAWPAREAVEPSLRSWVSAEGVGSVSTAVPWIRSHVCVREAGGIGAG